MSYQLHYMPPSLRLKIEQTSSPTPASLVSFQSFRMKLLLRSRTCVIEARPRGSPAPSGSVGDEVMDMIFAEAELLVSIDVMIRLAQV